RPEDRGARPSLHHGRRAARHYVRAAEPAWGGGDRDQLRGHRGQGEAVAHLLRPARRARHERLSAGESAFPLAGPAESHAEWLGIQAASATKGAIERGP